MDRIDKDPTGRVWALAAALTVGCGGSEADELRDQIEADDYRESYDRAPGWEQPRAPSQGGPHGDFVDIYVNDVMAEAIAQAQASGAALERWPEGSIIVKDTWTAASGGELVYLAFMERRAEGWFWGEYRRGRRLVSAGLHDDTCTGCHAAGQDEVRAFPLPPYPASE